jgi:FkbM family methyltransferase
VNELKTFLLKSAAWAARVLPAPVKRLLYRTPWLARFTRRTLNEAAPKGSNEVIIAAGILRGMRMSLDLQSEKDYWLGTYEPDLQEAAHRLIQPGMVVYDIGANIGYISLMAARLAKENGHVYSFEALPGNVDRLKANIDLNNLGGQITAIHAAVTDHTGEAVFLAHESGAMGKALGSAGREEHYAAELRVPALAMDDVVFEQGNPPPQLIKMDIEGGEGMALRGMEKILGKIRPIFMIELHGQKAAQQVWESLTCAGYRIHRMQGSMPEVTALEDLDWKAYIIAIPN